MIKTVIKNGRVLDPGNGRDEVTDILIENDRLLEIRKDIPVSKGDTIVIDASGKVVTPGLIDVHVHFREPGYEYKETIHTGSRAAAMGGFTSVVCEPNTNPPIDTGKRVRTVLDIAEKTSLIKIFTKACISRNQKSERSTNVKELVEAGAVALSDDGHPVASEKLVKNALIKGAQYNLVVTPHCEESEFYRKKVAEKKGNDFLNTTTPYTRETWFVRRDLEINREIKSPLHISHISYKETVEEIERAKSEKIPLTAEAAPHHFTLTEAMGKQIGPNAKVNPPLRNEKDVQAILQGLKNNTIEIIATDHAPHSREEKNRAWDQAPFGLIGLETALGLVLTKLVHENVLTLSEAIAKMTINPARIFRLNRGTLSIGAPADITIIDTEKEWTVDADKFESKGRNCPFNGWKLKGKAVITIAEGKIVMHEGKIIENPSSLYEEWINSKA